MTSRAIQKGLDAFELDAGVTYLDNKPAIHCRRWQTRSSPAHAAPTLRMDSPRWRGKTDQPSLLIVQKISLDKSNV